jgi:hypothetical protein
MATTLNPATESDPVRRYTSPAMLQRIEDQIAHNIRFYASQPDHVIAERIEGLKREWSIERYLQANAAAVGFTTALLALLKNRKWALLTCGALGFFLYHGLKGFDPPIPLLRKAGVRTRTEIDRERYALKALRGDFKDIPKAIAKPTPNGALAALDAVNA